MRSNLISVVALLAGCSSVPPAAPPGAGAEFVLAVKVPPGSEIHQCQFVRMPAGDWAVTGASHDYTPGSHHFLVFRTDLDAIPAGLEGAASCFESGRGVMTYARGVLYGSQVPTGALRLPAGVGIPVRPEEVLLLQAHYINPGERELDARVTVKLRTDPAASIGTKAGILFFYNPFIYVPAGSMATAAMRCKIPTEVTLHTAVSHYHRRGVAYGAYLDSASGELAATPFYTSQDWEHPEPRVSPLAVAAGSAIRFECTYDNRSGTRDYFQGRSAEDNEMCMFTGVYYPAMTRADETCRTAPDRLGTGDRTCAQTTTCLRGCPAGSAPTVLEGQPTVNECWQRCIATSCPAASAPLLAQLTCLRNRCALECASGADACASCARARCFAEAAACAVSSCG